MSLHLPQERGIPTAGGERTADLAERDPQFIPGIEEGDAVEHQLVGERASMVRSAFGSLATDAKASS